MIIRIFSYLIFTILIFLAFFFTSLAILEWGGISKIFFNKIIYKDKLFIHQTNYYGETLEEDPYKPYIIQHLHPYYIFGMNWKKDKNTKLNNLIVNLDRDGFRQSLEFENKENEIIILGGSTAFGIGSSSDKKTISSIISSKTKYNALNRAYSGWNSHQELIALVKYNRSFKYSLSLTGINDFNNFCKTPKSDRNNFPDLPENFFLLADYFDDLEGKPILTFNKKFKKFFIYNFPNTKRVYSYIKNKYLKKKDKNLKKNVEFCGGKKEIDKLVNQFLANQSSMKKYAKSTGAKHWIIIQPILSMHKNNRYGNENKKEMMEYYIAKIMNSEVCSSNCLDLSNFFEKFQNQNYFFSRDNSDLNKAIFIDESHFLDHATEKVVNKIIESVNFN